MHLAGRSCRDPTHSRASKRPISSLVLIWLGDPFPPVSTVPRSFFHRRAQKVQPGEKLLHCPLQPGGALPCHPPFMPRLQRAEWRPVSRAIANRRPEEHPW